MSVYQFLLSTDTNDLNYPEIRPTLDLNFAQTKVLDPRITFIRNSGGSYIGPNGLIKYAGINEPRFDHHPITGESLGLLVEESMINHVPTSIPSGYLSFGRAIQTTGITAPDGSTDAINYNNTGDPSRGVDYIYTTFNTSFTIGTQYVISIFSTNPTTIITQGGISQGKYTTLNSTQHIPYPNGWYRHWRIFQATVYNPNITPQIVIELSGSTANLSLWGMQVEQGSFPTSYIPTIGTTRTRLADQASITSSSFTNFFNTSQGTFFADYKSTDPTNTRILNFGTGETSTIISNEGVMGSGLYFSGIGNIAGAASNGVKVATSTSIFESAGAFNGNMAVSTGACSYYANSTSLNFAPSSFGAPIKQNWLRRITYWPKRLPNEQLQALTR